MKNLPELIKEKLKEFDFGKVNELIPFELTVNLGYSTHGFRPLGNIWLVREANGIWEARQAFDIFGGSGNEPETGPFKERYMNNYSRGRATTKEKAIEIMIREAMNTAESIWY